MEIDFTPLNEINGQLQEFGDECVDALTIASERATDDNTFKTDTELHNITDLGSENYFEPDDTRETIGYFPKQASNPLSIDLFDGLHEHFTHNTDTEYGLEPKFTVTLAPTHDGGKLIFTARGSHQKSCRYLEVSIMVDQTGQVHATLTYGTDNEVFRTHPVTNTIYFLSGVSSPELPLSDEHLTQLRQNVNRVVVLDRYAREIAETSYAAYRPALVTLLSESGLTHEEIGDVLGSSRSTVSSQASEFRNLQEKITEHKEKLETTRKLTSTGDIQEFVKNQS